MIDNRTVGKTISALRQARGMTQQQLAAAMNVSHQAVSKWENGAALPDIQTLMELTQLFGVTVEQLLSGEIPQSRLDNSPTLDDHLKNIGSFVGGVISDIGGMFHREPKSAQEDAPQEDAPQEVAPEGEGAAEEQALVPEEQPSGQEVQEEQKLDVSRLIEMAPFMSRAALEDMLLRSRQTLSASEIAHFAPFVSSACLERLILENGTEINWDTLRRLAPFLKREAVDAFTRAVASGEKLVKPATEELNRAAGDVYKALDDVSRKISRGVDKAVQKVVRLSENVVSEVSKAFDGASVERQSREERAARLRRSALERALEDERWDWIEAHVSELQDDDLKQRIVDKAFRLGKQDWVEKNLAGFAGEEAVEKAIEGADWQWLTENLGLLSPEQQHRVVLKTMREEGGDWLAQNIGRLELAEFGLETAAAARRSGKKHLACELAAQCLMPGELEELACEAFNASDYDFVEMISGLLPPSTLSRCCEKLAKSGDWENVYRFAVRFTDDELEGLMEIAIDAGNFDAIDALDEIIRAGDEQ